MMKRIIICLLGLAFLGGCWDHDDMTRMFIPESVDIYARDYIRKIIEKDFEGVYAPLNPELKNEETKQNIEQVFNYVKGTEIVSLAVAGINAHEFNGETSYKTYNITYQIEYPNAWQVANLLIFENDQGIMVNRVNLNDIPKSLPEMNKFTFSQKSWLHFAFFAATVGYIVFIICALVTCVRINNLKRKWLWAVITILGIVQFSFDWTTGHYSIQPISFGFAISGFYSPSPFMPVILQFYLPVGAVVFFMKRKSLSATTKPEDISSSGSPNEIV